MHANNIHHHNHHKSNKPSAIPFLFWDLEPVTKAGQARGLDSGGALVGEPQGRMGRIWQLATIACVFFTVIMV